MKVVMTTVGGEESAREIALKLLNEKLAACISFFPIRSVYWWKGEVESSEEFLLIIKTSDGKVDELMEYLARVHPYDVPEIIVLSTDRVWPPYGRWIEDVTLR